MIQRRDIAISIVLSIVTCGIYGIYWYYKLAQEVNIVTDTTNDTSAGMVLILTFITCGIYGLYWAYHAGERMAVTKQSRNIPSGGSEPVLYLILYLVAGIGAYAIVQNDINMLINR